MLIANRNFWNGMTLVVFCSLMFAAGFAQSAEAPVFDSVWGEGTNETVKLCCESQFSATANGDAMSIIIGVKAIDIQNEGALSAAWAAKFRLPYKDKKLFKGNRINNDLRFFVDKSTDSRVVILIDLGVRQETLVYPYGSEQKGNIFKRFVNAAETANRQGHTVSIFVTAERTSNSGLAMVSFDSLDVCLKRPVKNSVCVQP